MSTPQGWGAVDPYRYEGMDATPSREFSPAELAERRRSADESRKTADAEWQAVLSARTGYQTAAAQFIANCQIGERLAALAQSGDMGVRWHDGARNAVVWPTSQGDVVVARWSYRPLSDGMDGATRRQWEIAAMERFEASSRYDQWGNRIEWRWVAEPIGAVALDSCVGSAEWLREETIRAVEAKERAAKAARAAQIAQWEAEKQAEVERIRAEKDAEIASREAKWRADEAAKDSAMASRPASTPKSQPKSLNGLGDAFTALGF